MPPSLGMNSYLIQYTAETVSETFTGLESIDRDLALSDGPPLWSRVGIQLPKT